MSLVRAYLRSLHEIRALRTGTGERSYYPALQSLLNGIGEQCRPRVLCVQELADWCRQHTDPEARRGFSAMGAAWHLRLPVLRGLFEAVNTPGALGPLRLDEVLEWAAATLFTLRPIGNKTRLLSGNSVRWITRRHVSGIVRPAAIRS